MEREPREKLNTGWYEVRDLRNGEWYWIHKAVIQEYATNVGPTGIAVYNFLASMADRAQRCFPSQGYIARSLGCSQSTVSRAVQVLAHQGLIRRDKSRYHSVYYLLKVSYSTGASEVSHRRIRGTSPVHTNKNKVTRIKNNSTYENENSPLESTRTQTNTLKTREELLAEDIAVGLDDQQRLSLYLSYAKKHPEQLLRRVLSEVRGYPVGRIKKSRGALFSYLVKKYGEETNHSNRH